MIEAYTEKIRTTEPHLLEVRTKGMPTFGAGLVYPINTDSIIVPPFAIPAEYYYSYALDIGWNWNAAVFAAEDRQADITYIYDVYKRGQVEPPIVAEAVKARGTWMSGVGDCADVNRLDGKQYFEIYTKLGLDVQLPNKAIETGITQVWNRFSTGRLKIFSTCSFLLDELRIYMRDKDGHVKEDQNDHCMDALRYLIMSGLTRGKQMPKPGGYESDWMNRPVGGDYAWMA